MVLERGKTAHAYRLLSTWLLAAERERVWAAMADCLAWPDWWPAVAAIAELHAGDARRVGATYRVIWRAPGPGYRVGFEFRVDAVDAPVMMVGRARGDVEGSGTFRLFEQDGLTALTLDWRVRARRPALRAAGLICRPVLRAAHARTMAGGAVGLAALLDARLVAHG